MEVRGKEEECRKRIRGRQRREEVRIRDIVEWVMSGRGSGRERESKQGMY